MDGHPPARRGRIRGRLAAGALVVAAMLPSCAAGPTGDQLYAQAREANLLFKQSVATVLLHIEDGDWQVQEYGDMPVTCDGGYSFSMHRTTFEGWTLDADASTTGRRLAEWLRSRGWNTRDVATGADGAVVVEASDRAVGVATLTIDIRDGEASADAVGVGATSTCYDGDPGALAAILYPRSGDRPREHEPLPVVEAAGARPVFGFTEDGEPR
ncbi:hypothetical protein [Microbacterium timonense]|uniref:hypothetical protein n=1 Tax=Microbacterium timonense TaxID=2086576 RepID=UPI000D1008B3|nr:hypothetical protein [Microbacterium timonense]